jgi:ABC-2 type transport system permease protein
MWWFHTVQFARNGYFVQLLLTSTLGMVALQALASRGTGTTDSLGWARAGIVGTWTVCTAAAGMIGYQRFQGTLVHLVRSPLAPWRVLLPVIGSASVVGVAALPIAAGAWALLGHPVHPSGPAPLIGAVLLLWVSCLSISAVVGALFVLSPNAMTYEGLLAVPLVLISGVFGTPAGLPSAVVGAAHVLPTRGAVEALLAVAAGKAPDPATVLGSLAAAICWLAVAHLATLEVI